MEGIHRAIIQPKDLVVRPPVEDLFGEIPGTGATFIPGETGLRRLQPNEQLVFDQQTGGFALKVNEA